MRKILPELIVPFILILLSTGCTPTGNTLSDTGGSAKNILKVGVTSNAPPMIYRQNGRFTGLEAELARELGKFAGKTAGNHIQGRRCSPGIQGIGQVQLQVEKEGQGNRVRLVEGGGSLPEFRRRHPSPRRSG
jgi:ABC-type amino acid transport substrate-binding protein